MRKCSCRKRRHEHPHGAPCEQHEHPSEVGRAFLVYEAIVNAIVSVCGPYTQQTALGQVWLGQTQLPPSATGDSQVPPETDKCRRLTSAAGWRHSQVPPNAAGDSQVPPVTHKCRRTHKCCRGLTSAAGCGHAGMTHRLAPLVAWAGAGYASASGGIPSGAVLGSSPTLCPPPRPCPHCQCPTLDPSPPDR